MDFDDLYVALNLMLGDENNFALSSDQKRDSLTRAFNDQYAVTEVEDSSLVFDIGTATYTIPTGISVVREISTATSSDQFPDPISADLWEVINGTIRFVDKTRGMIGDTQTLTIKGWHKVDITDTINDEGLQNYILSLAGYLCLRNLAYTKVMKFVRNDTTVSEIIGMRREFERDVQAYRRQLLQAYQPN